MAEQVETQRPTPSDHAVEPGAGGACVDPTTLHTATSGLSPMYGVYSGVVNDVVDPQNLGRVRISLPWAPEYEVWARVATLMAGADRGTWFMPQVDDEVLVAFEAGDPQRPFVMGALWNGQDAPPRTMDSAGQNDIKVIRSRNGVTVTLDDTQGQEQFVCETPGGRKVILRDGAGAIEIEGGNGSSVKLDGSGITIDTNSNVRINGSTVELSAALLQVNAGMSDFSGVVKCDTLITNTVISNTYTPGAGNII